MEAVYEKYFRDNLPHIWCPGCGNGIVMSAWLGLWTSWVILRMMCCLFLALAVRPE